MLSADVRSELPLMTDISLGAHWLTPDFERSLFGDSSDLNLPSSLSGVDTYSLLSPSPLSVFGIARCPRRCALGSE